ncbi:heme oxygenase [Parasponia andersonii]|uniref:Heme oxygenase n=1 Tax=Parasponia andersonii TaxID=3476 RepID=A0A2P5B6H8_PARAD|nr:heme oxygenase [Parasponia andersonii]
MAAKEEGIARGYWKDNMEESVFALFSPFFVSVAAGNLDPSTFRHCISMDLHFLQAFAQAYEMAEDCADDNEEKKLIRHLHECVHKKLHAYDAVVQKWGFEIPKSEGVPDSMTAKYKQFLLRIASGIVEGEQVPCKTATPFEKTKVAAYTLAAIAPFMRLKSYLCLVTRMILTYLHPNNTSDHMYKNWLHYYSSDQEIQELAKKTEDVLDTLSAPLTGEELRLTAKLYNQAVKLQVEYFASLPIPQQQRTVVPLARVQDLNNDQLTIFSDFDLTCSVVDCAAMLARLATVITPCWTLADLKKELDAISKQYVDGYEHCVESITIGVPGEVFDCDGLCKALEKVAEFEKQANARVEESGVFKGLTLHGIKHAGQSILLHNGCREFFQKIKNEHTGIDAHVISYSWCGELIRSAFSSDLKASNIHSNELAFTEESVTTGEIIKKVETPFEKHQAFMKILQGRESSSNSNQGNKHLKVYIGGAVGDLVCLVEADIGIVFGSSSASLKKLGTHFGVSFVPLLRGVVNNQMELVDWKPKSGILYTVETWAEIQAFILGL